MAARLRDNPPRYLAFDGDRLWHPLQPDHPPSNPCAHVHADLRAHVQATEFPCVGAKSAFNRRRYRMGCYGPMGQHTDTVTTALALLHDLYEFSHEFATPGPEPVSFLACFDGPVPENEVAFERSLWSLLQAMHRLDAQWFAWDQRVSDQPDHDTFSFSLGERAFFIVGMHPQASRLSRRTPMVAVAFNLHEQFEGLREKGKYANLQDAIRARDVALQGSVNPVLRQFGDSSEARQYSGRAVPEGWVCPFHRVDPSNSGEP